MTLRLALISDIHGNIDALEAALAEIEKQAPDRIVILGDLVLNGPRPVETVDRVIQQFTPNFARECTPFE